MRAIPTLVRSLLLGCAALAMVACGDEVVGQKSCSTDNDCIKIAGDVYNADTGVGNPPQCCNKVCVLQVAGGGGCESGYRFLTTLPGYGACVAEPMCSTVERDLTVTPVEDMSMPNDGSND